jgi:ATP-dependent Clp protease adaptor protein ClpS
MPYKKDFDTDVLVEEAVSLEDLVSDITGNTAHLIVHNDEHNTFEHVIECFMDVLHYDSAQAEQLAYIIHFKGKATVKTASYSTLKPFKDALIDRGLSAVIEETAK